MNRDRKNESSAFSHQGYLTDLTQRSCLLGEPFKIFTQNHAKLAVADTSVVYF